MGYLFCLGGRELYFMEGNRIFKKILEKISHLPTLLLVVGYPVFWLELYVFNSRNGQTSFLALGLFIVFSVVFLSNKKGNQPALPSTESGNVLGRDIIITCLLGAGILIACVCLFFAFSAALLPPHLPQEFDSLNYHITLPRQHLILGSFKHIPWAADDFFLLPLEFALAPFWFVTTLPNKIPQFFFFVGMVLAAVNLTRYFGQNRQVNIILVVLAILGSHHVGIQMGSAMLDLVICYLFLAALDSFLKGRMKMCLLEFTFFFWSKSFMPVQVTAIFIGLIFMFVFLRKMGFKDIRWSWDREIGSKMKARYRSQYKKMLGAFLILSIFIGGPFLIKSTYYSGTPLFPFAVGSIMVNKNIDQDSKHWQSIEGSSKQFFKSARRYGYPKSLSTFFKHFWLVAVPDKGVNNKYDYPLGLVYLLMVGPFIVMLGRSLKKREFMIIPFFISLFWMSWWFGSQQSRYLYVPIMLMIILVIAQMKAPSKIFMGAVFVALLLNTLSVYRAHKAYFGLPMNQVLGPKDVKLLKLTKTYIV